MIEGVSDGSIVMLGYYAMMGFIIWCFCKYS